MNLDTSAAHAVQPTETARDRYISAMQAARDLSQEATRVADAAISLAAEDWGKTNNRVLRSLAHDVAQTNTKSSSHAIAAIMIALAA